jgi:hypothetical protein
VVLDFGRWAGFFWGGGGEISPNFTLKTWFRPVAKKFHEKKTQICQISIFFFPNRHIFNEKFQQVAKNIEGLFFFYFSYLACSQIWLNHLSDGCHFSYITKLDFRKKKPWGER